jgi:hypothetical protein
MGSCFAQSTTSREPIATSFHRDIEPIAAQILEVFVMNAEGTEQTPLTTLPSENGHPGWGRGRAVP